MARTISGDVAVVEHRRRSAARDRERRPHRRRGERGPGEDDLGRRHRAGRSAAALLSLGTISGSVTATKLKGRSLDASGVSGTVRSVDIQMDRVLAKSVPARSSSPARWRRAAPTSSAPTPATSASPCPRQRVRADADTFSGRVQTEFPVAGRGGDRDAAGRRTPGVRGRPATAGRLRGELPRTCGSRLFGGRK